MLNILYTVSDFCRYGVLESEKYKQHTQTITQVIMVKITKMIRFFLMQLVNIADGDLSTKLSSKNHCQNSIKEF